MTDLTAGGGHKPTPTESKKNPRKTYPQDWPAYNKAQANELRDFGFVLRNLSQSMPKEYSFQQPKGRHRIPLPALTYAAIFKAYHCLPGRLLGSIRDGGPLVALHDAGFISRPMHWNSVGNALRDERMSEVFEFLVEKSALPLVPVERGDFSLMPVELGDFSADSTVIDGVSRVQEGDPNYPGQSQYRTTKLHLVTGNRSHVITACAIE